MANDIGLLVYKPKEVGDWLPVTPPVGPPLPQFLEIYWPWYKPELPPLPPGVVYYCPYCDEMFLTPELLAAHIAFFHPEEEPVEPEPEPPPVPGLPVTYSNLMVPTEVVPVGKAILISFDLTNRNYYQVLQPVTLSGSFNRSWQVKVPADSTITESFTVKPMEPGSFLIKVDGL